jgi:hypothetical protein
MSKDRRVIIVEKRAPNWPAMVKVRKSIDEISPGLPLIRNKGYQATISEGTRIKLANASTSIWKKNTDTSIGILHNGEETVGGSAPKVLPEENGSKASIGKTIDTLPSSGRIVRQCDFCQTLYISAHSCPHSLTRISDDNVNSCIPTDATMRSGKEVVGVRRRKDIQFAKPLNRTSPAL